MSSTLSQMRADGRLLPLLAQASRHASFTAQPAPFFLPEGEVLLSLEPLRATCRSVELSNMKQHS
jgi:hypothetical protein